MMRIWFREWERIVFVCLNAIEDFRGDGNEILHRDERFRDDDGNLHDDVRSVRVNGNDDRFSHGGDENVENDEEGNDMTESDGDDGGIRSVRIYSGSHDGGDRTVNGDDESSDQSDENSRGRKFQGRCFLRR